MCHPKSALILWLLMMAAFINTLHLLGSQFPHEYDTARVGVRRGDSRDRLLRRKVFFSWILLLYRTHQLCAHQEAQVMSQEAKLREICFVVLESSWLSLCCLGIDNFAGVTTKFMGNNECGGIKRVNSVEYSEWSPVHSEHSVSVSCYCHFIVLPLSGL